MTEDEMVGWHQQLNGHEFEQALGVGDGQEILVCCSSWGHRKVDTAKRLNKDILRWRAAGWQCCDSFRRTAH